MIVRLTVFYLFLSLYLNRAHGHEVTGTPNPCTLDKTQEKCEINANDIIEFDVKCKPSFVDDYDVLKLPKGSFVTHVDASKIQIQVANVISTEETKEFTQKCDGESDKKRTLTYKKGGKELQLPGVDFTGSSIHFKLTKDTLTKDETFPVDVGKWEKGKTIGLACPHTKAEDMKCFATVFDDTDKEVAFDTLLPGAKFDHLKSHFPHTTIKHIESLVTLTEVEPTDKPENEIKKTSFKCKCKVGEHTGTVHFTAEVEFPKKEGSNTVNPKDPEGTDPNKNNSPLTASVHNVFGLLSVFLYFYLNSN